jgi:putative transposase
MKKTSSQHWQTFIRNHAQSIVACDFLVAVTANFRLVYVFILMEIGTRRILHFNVTAHPTAAWTVQQFREAVPTDHPFRFSIHDRDSIFSTEVDHDPNTFGLKTLRTPVRAPQANAYCERLIGTIRRECLDFVIPLGGKHLRRIMREGVIHYNQGRPHSSLGPGLPESAKTSSLPINRTRHRLPNDATVTATKILGGLHHEYALQTRAA